MNTPDLTCRDDLRRHKARAIFNGLDFVEVSDDQRTLDLHFFQSPPADLQKDNIQITGGSRIPTVAVVDIHPCAADRRDRDECLSLTVESPGDFSTYTLSLVTLDDEGKPTDAALPGFDPRYSQVRFTFKASCPSDLDCQQPDVCPPSAKPDPEIDYLAKDYASFRQLMLDRLAVTMPEWTERHVPDVGIALVEVLAYVGDYLSYHQDAVATEAYLATARRRASVRRHARLVDYQLHEGSNARAWIHVRTTDDFAGDGALDPRSVFFISADEGVSALSRQVLTLDDIRSVPYDRYEVFEPIDQQTKIALQTDQNEISFHTWGDGRCCLPAGATRATLRDTRPLPVEPPPVYQTKEPAASRTATGPKGPPAPPPAPVPPPAEGLTLTVGDVLVFEEIRGPITGNPADADSSRRHVVRLTRVTPAVDEVEQQTVLEIEWALEDALPFPLCLTAVAGQACATVEVSVARGNMVLVDHGRTVSGESLGVVSRRLIETGCEGSNCPGEIAVAAETFQPVLAQAPLIYALPVNRSQPAALQLGPALDVRDAVPAINLTGIPAAPGGAGPLVPANLFSGGDWDAFVDVLRTAQTPASQYLRTWLGVRMRKILMDGTAGDALREAVGRLQQDWRYRPDLINSSGLDRHFAIEVDNEGRAHLRFGDGELGRQPEAGTAFVATYRIGACAAGNVGAERISHIVFRTGTASGIDLRPRNPLPARGGIAPETLAEARLFAPHRFRSERLRAITAGDYAHLAGRHPKVQRAAATLQWTGNGYEALVAIDQRDRPEVEASVLKEVADLLDPYRRIGHSVRTVQARLVALRLNLTVCVLPTYLRGHVKAAVLDVLSARTRADGRAGMFHPDTLTFGQSIYLSAIVAAVQALPGVESVAVNNFERLFDGPAGEIDSGFLALGPLEVARLDNDPSLPENGRLDLDMRGGR